MILLKDVKYLSGTRKSQIPSVALEIFESNQLYSDYLHLLQVLTERYNHPLSSIVDFERPMFQKHIDNIDEILEKGITQLTWTDPTAKEFLENAVIEVSQFSELHNKSTSNLKVIKQKIELWKKPALFARVDPKKSLDPAEVTNHLNARSATISRESEEILKLVHSSVSSLTGDDPSLIDSPCTLR